MLGSWRVGGLLKRFSKSKGVLSQKEDIGNWMAKWKMETNFKRISLKIVKISSNNMFPYKGFQGSLYRNGDIWK